MVANMTDRVADLAAASFVGAVEVASEDRINGRCTASEGIVDYVVIVEKGETSYGAYIPDLPGCIAIGETREEALQLIREAINFHLEGLEQDGLPIPEPTSSIETVRVTA
jgi:predicted RNase H-like HicB family nuclease